MAPDGETMRFKWPWDIQKTNDYELMCNDARILEEQRTFLGIVKPLWMHN
jgi:hypothetical protein